MSILSKDRVLTVEEGSKVQIDCSTEGYPAPKVHWVQRNKPGEVLSKVSTLVLSHVAPEQAGEYLCIATNQLGTSQDQIKINVLCKLCL